MTEGWADIWASEILKVCTQGLPCSGMHDNTKFEEILVRELTIEIGT